MHTEAVDAVLDDRAIEAAVDNALAVASRRRRHTDWRRCWGTRRGRRGWCYRLSTFCDRERQRRGGEEVLRAVADHLAVERLVRDGVGDHLRPLAGLDHAAERLVDLDLGHHLRGVGKDHDETVAMHLGADLRRVLAAAPPR